jgi:predicted exporter
MRVRVLSIGIWIMLASLAALVAARARYTADLSAFLPNAPTHAQRFLVEQLRDGLVSRLILAEIGGADPSTCASLSRRLAARLRADRAFRAVMNGEATDLERDRNFVFEHRYLLSERITPARFTVEGLEGAIGEGIGLLASPMGLLAKDLFVRDPTGETLQVIGQLEQTSAMPRVVDGVWASRDGRRAVLVAETRAAGADPDGQERAIVVIRRAFAEAQREVAGTPAILRLTGPGVFAVEARSTIEHEAVRLSILSSAVIATFLLLVYRSLPALLLGLLPVVSGALAGVAAVALGFGVVHGVTLGFGVTLIGEAVDYSVYLFIQARHGPAAAADQAGWTATIWPTIRLGMLTSICGFASLLPSAFPGLAQLGLYSIAGLVAAGLVTRFVLPQLLPPKLVLRAALPLGRALARARRPLQAARGVLWLVPVVAAVALYAHRDRLWNHELSALSPVPVAEQVFDGELRADLGAPDVRTLIVLAGPDQQAVLRAAEALQSALDTLVGQGVLAGFQSPSHFLPSLAVQEARRASLPPRVELTARLERAVASLPVRAGRLQPFVNDIAATRAAPLVRRSDLEGTSLAAGVDALLVRRSERWHALMPLQAPRSGPGAYAIDVERVARAVHGVATPGVEANVLDLKHESDALYAGYLAEALRLSLFGFAAIVVLLLVSLRSAPRVARVIGPLVLAVLVVVAGFAFGGHALTILHLIGLLLVIAIGSNYALFFDRESPRDDPDAAARMLASLLIANLATVIAFGVLSFSTVPVLAALGSTVAPGTLLALLFSAALSGDRPPLARSG